MYRTSYQNKRFVLVLAHPKICVNYHKCRLLMFRNFVSICNYIHKCSTSALETISNKSLKFIHVHLLIQTSCLSSRIFHVVFYLTSFCLYLALFVNSLSFWVGEGNLWIFLYSFFRCCHDTIILDGKSEHVAEVWRKIGIFGLRNHFVAALDLFKCLIQIK